MLKSLLAGDAMQMETISFCSFSVSSISTKFCAVFLDL